MRAEQRATGLTDFNDLTTQNPEVVSIQLDEVLQGVREQGRAATQSVELAGIEAPLTTLRQEKIRPSSTRLALNTEVSVARA